MTITVGTVLKVVAVLSWLDGDIAQNVFNAVITGSGGPYDEEDVVADALAWVGLMYAEVVEQLSDEIDGSEVRVYEYDPVDDDFDEVGSAAWTYDPTETTEQLPRGTAGLINAKTTDPDVNGKKYLPGLCEGASVDGLWGTGVVALMVNFADVWVGTFVGGTSGAAWTPGIWSPTKGNLLPASGTVLVPSIPAYQRRRKQGVGI
jgi:hypothetical protein